MSPGTCNVLCDDITPPLFAVALKIHFAGSSTHSSQVSLSRLDLTCVVQHIESPLHFIIITALAIIVDERRSGSAMADVNSTDSMFCDICSVSYYMLHNRDHGQTT
nr:uncharacterized protein LOC116768739 [Danaus plexippus plexippus]